MPAPTRHWPVLLASLGAAATVAACSSSSPPGAPAATRTPTGPPAGQAPAGSQAASLQQTFVDVVKRVRPSVVQIETDQGLGSGIVFDAKGDIVTNAHVVGTATAFKVTKASGGGALDATLVGSYQPDDIAVIHVNDGSLRAATFADSSRLQVGDVVLAIGNPLGLSSSVTEGIVSATGRTVSEPAEGSAPPATLPDVIQTSAAINPGNSGGALVDLSGDVVGIPTLAATDQQLGGAAPGIGFAIPSSTVRDIAGQLIASGHVTSSHRAALGVRVANADNGGVLIAQVTAGGPADKAGLKSGDVITAVDAQDTATTEALSQVLANRKPGDTVQLSVTRADGTTTTVTVTLGQLPGG